MLFFSPFIGTGTEIVGEWRHPENIRFAYMVQKYV
jgi:hypothetical protein